MDEATKLRTCRHWRVAVWGLRMMGLGLAVVAVGLVGLVWSSGTGLVILAVGMGIYLLAVLITVVGCVLVYREFPPPRPNFIWLRWSLLHDAVHARSAGPEPRADALAERQGHSPTMESLRRSSHWRLAIWGTRAMGPGLAIVIAGLLTLVWSTATARVILAVGLALYLAALVFSLVEVRWAYGDVQPPRPEYARVRQFLVHDTLHTRS